MCALLCSSAPPQDKGYLWIEIPLSDIFKLDVSGMKSVDDYAKLLSKKGRWNFKDRQKKCADGGWPSGGLGGTTPGGGWLSLGSSRPCAHPELARAAAHLPPPTRARRFVQGLTCEYVPLELGDRELVDSLWPLYKK